MIVQCGSWSDYQLPACDAFNAYLIYKCLYVLLYMVILNINIMEYKRIEWISMYCNAWWLPSSSREKIYYIYLTLSEAPSWLNNNRNTECNYWPHTSIQEKRNSSKDTNNDKSVWLNRPGFPLMCQTHTHSPYSDTISPLSLYFLYPSSYSLCRCSKSMVS
jgi:hypothetical protein